jgi:hypothetical protein
MEYWWHTIMFSAGNHGQLGINLAHKQWVQVNHDQTLDTESQHIQGVWENQFDDVRWNIGGILSCSVQIIKASWE